MQRLLLLAVLLAGCNDKPAAPPVPQTTSPAPVPAPADAAEAPVHEVKTDMPPAHDIAPLVKANNNFALELWAHAGSGNAAISPLSISTALAMAFAGAKGDTAAEMRKTMHLEGDTDLVVSQWARVSYALQAADRPLKLAMANRLYGDAHYQFDTIYFTITRKAFSAPLEIVDFRGDPEGVRAKINAWVAERTEQRIKELVPPHALGADTRLAIINAIYFLADWAAPFASAQTTDADFHTSATQKQRVRMMHRQGQYKLAKADGAALLELPYTGDSAAMYIVLPDRIDGLPAVERTLPATLKALQSKLADQTVAVSLPRFTIDGGPPLRLVPALQQLGMKLPFDPDKADFTGIANPTDPKDRLYIGDVLHKAFVKVDEKGTEAAAATAVLAPRAAAMPQQAVAFTADHPFLFLIVDKGSGLILFIGRVVAPPA